MNFQTIVRNAYKTLCVRRQKAVDILEFKKSIGYKMRLNCTIEAAACTYQARSIFKWYQAKIKARNKPNEIPTE